MKSWQLVSTEVEPHFPRILSSTTAARTILLCLSEGERLDPHHVHERAFVVVLSGTIEVRGINFQCVSGGVGLMLEFEPGEPHAVIAQSEARLLLTLAPWPGHGHPGAMTLEEKARARDDAAEHELFPQAHHWVSS